MENLKKNLEEWIPETPDYVKGLVFTGNRDFSVIIMEWENISGSGNILLVIYDEIGDPKGIYDIQEYDVKRAVKILIHMFETLRDGKSKLTTSVEIRK